jgi:hypothetical protein
MLFKGVGCVTSILINVPKNGKLLYANLLSDGVCIVKIE